jgi:hypothetical protein
LRETKKCVEDTAAYGSLQPRPAVRPNVLHPTNCPSLTAQIPSHDFEEAKKTMGKEEQRRK